MISFVSSLLSRTPSRRVMVGAVLSLFFLAGCTLTEPKPDPTRFYILAPSVEADFSEMSARERPMTVGLRLPSLPDYLNQRQMVIREGPAEINFREYHRWGERLDDAIMRLMGGVLESTPVVRQVDAHPWTQRRTHDLVVNLQIEHFEGDDSGNVLIEASWKIMEPHTQEILGTARFEQSGSWTPGDFQSLALALANGGHAMSVAVAESIEEIRL